MFNINIKRKAKSRLKKEPITLDERVMPFVMFGACTLISFFCYGLGQLKMMTEVWDKIPVIEGKEYVIIEKRDRKMTEKEMILEYIVKVFGEDSADAITMIRKCENSKFDPMATNHNRNGTIDRGIFQINSVHGGDEMYGWKTNIDTAKKIFDQRGWEAWSCAEVVGVTPFWKK